jgi:hypothetical protein
VPRPIDIISTYIISILLSAVQLSQPFLVCSFYFTFSSVAHFSSFLLLFFRFHAFFCYPIFLHVFFFCSFASIFSSVTHLFPCFLLLASMFSSGSLFSSCFLYYFSSCLSAQTAIVLVLVLTICSLHIVQVFKFFILIVFNFMNIFQRIIVHVQPTHAYTHTHTHTHTHIYIYIYIYIYMCVAQGDYRPRRLLIKRLGGLSLRANYTDPVTATCWRS